MNTYTLKNFKVMAALSEETLCFTASLYRDGKKIGHVGNRGHGAWLVDIDRADDAIALTDHVDAMPEEDGYRITVDCFMSMLAEDAVQLRWGKSQCRTKTLFLLDGENADQGYRFVNAKYSDGIQKFLNEKYGDRVTFILNLNL